MKGKLLLLEDFKEDNTEFDRTDPRDFNEIGSPTYISSGILWEKNENIQQMKLEVNTNLMLYSTLF